MQRLRQSPTDPDFVQDPYPFYDRARALGELFLWDDCNMVCSVSHRATTAILRDRRFGREAPAEFAPPIPPHLAAFYAVEAHSMLELDPPRHTRLRGLVLRAFTSRRIAAMGPEIEQLCHDLVDRFPAGPFDLLDAYARILPVVIIARLLGVPEDRADDLVGWSNAMVAMYQAGRTRQMEDAAIAATNAFTRFITDYITEKRRHPADDLITQLIAAEEAGEKLSTDELVTTCILLLNAGHEATVHTMGNGVRTLLQNGIVPITETSVEEIIRHDPPLHMFTRWVNTDVHLFGHDFKRGDAVACLLGAANRDPLAYPDPARFDATRDGPANTSFGGGIHFCVGAPLARLELLIGMRVLFARCPTLRLAGPAHYADVFHFHGLASLPVEIGQRVP